MSTTTSTARPVRESSGCLPLVACFAIGWWLAPARPPDYARAAIELRAKIAAETDMPADLRDKLILDVLAELEKK